MTHILKTAALSVAGIVTLSGFTAPTQSSPSRSVEVSVAVTDRAGQPIRGLTEADFRVRENGRAVSLRAVRPVTAVEAATTGRSVVLLLGGSGVDPRLTPRVQELARQFIARSGAADQISVVRFTERRDEVSGSRDDMLMRIAEYRAPHGEPFNGKTWEGVLRKVTQLSRDLAAANAPGRRAIVWIGAPDVVDVIEPPLRRNELLWPFWTEAIAAAGQSNVSLYAIDPIGLTGRVRINPEGLIAKTGGTSFDGSNDFERALAQIWQDVSAYYTLRYDAAPSNSDVQSVDVKVSRPGAVVRARRIR